jgi:AAA domain
LHVEVIVVEEAAAVLESSIIAAFTSSTKHVVLIGDHVLLRPKVNEYNIATQHGFEISMFQRLIRMGCPFVRLTTQRRMHPEVCELITPSIYKTLTNDPSVSLYPEVTGIARRVVFITHEKPEDGQVLTGTKSGKAHTQPVCRWGIASFLN